MNSSVICNATGLLTTRAFLRTSTTPLVHEANFSSPWGFGVTRQDYHRLEFNTPMELGDCLLEAGARILFEPSQDGPEASTEPWDVTCHIVDTGLGRWRAIIVDDKRWSAPSDATPAQRVRASYSQSGRAIWFYHQDSPHIILTRYTGNVNSESGWMTRD